MHHLILSPVPVPFMMKMIHLFDDIHADSEILLVEFQAATWKPWAWVKFSYLKYVAICQPSAKNTTLAP